MSSLAIRRGAEPGPAPSILRHGGEALAIERFTAIEPVETVWRDLESAGEGTCYQRFDWVDAWLTEVGRSAGFEPLIVVGRRGGAPAFVWPFGVRREGLVRIARWLGDDSSNYNLGCYAPGEMSAFHPDAARRILDDCAAATGIDAFLLQRQPIAWNGSVNPLAADLPSLPSPSNGYACSLEPDFDRVLAARNGSHKRKKMRQKERQWENAGDYRVTAAASVNEAIFILDTFFEQKSRKLAEIGARDCFADPLVRSFYHRLAKRAHAEDRSLMSLHYLTAAGRIRAIAGVATHGGRASVLFLSYSDDEMARLSPGETLIYRMIEGFCAAGIATVDFGVGEERYKDSWCDATVRLAESYHAVTTTGGLYASAIKARDVVKRHVKQTPAAWDLYKRLRRLRGAAAGAPAPERT